MDNHVKNFLAANIIQQNGLVKDSADKIEIDLSIARSTIAPVLPTGGVERDGVGKLKLDVPTAQGLVTPVLANGSIIKDDAGKLSVDFLSSGGLLKKVQVRYILILFISQTCNEKWFSRPICRIFV